jgi:peptide-methionine (S)-S-oxide reductase
MRKYLMAMTGLVLAAVAAGKEKPMDATYEKATLAGGCFWCLQPPFDGKPGVISTMTGYTGGHVKNPTYEQVCDGDTGHLEAVEVVFDPAKISYGEVLDIFWRSIDPTDPGGQFADRGEQYKTAVFYHNEAQRKAAEASKKKLEASGVFSRPVAVEVRPAAIFYAAEEHHQKYYCKRPAHYNSYKEGSGRGGFLRDMWKGK